MPDNLSINDCICYGCTRFTNINKPCVINSMTSAPEKYPDIRFNNKSDCMYYFKSDKVHYPDTFEEDTSDINVLKYNYYSSKTRKLYTGSVDILDYWTPDIINIAKDKIKSEILQNEMDDFNNLYLDTPTVTTDMEEQNTNDEISIETITENELLNNVGNINNVITNSNNLHDVLADAWNNGYNYSNHDNFPNNIVLRGTLNDGTERTLNVQLEDDWDINTKEIAIGNAQKELDHIIELENLKLENKSTSIDLSDEEKNKLKEAKTILDKFIGIDNKTSECNNTEETLEGDIKIGWFNQSTTWQRVMNAARRTIGKKPLEKEPSDSWKAKILLAEHSPIRLLEYDWGWEKIRQWVTVHLVRHHVGVEKFVHSQRSDRRELPCDRDHLYQGARNDMDMTANAQGLINMSRKRCCNCASTETREAWKLVLDELEKKDPVMRSKCVRECVYRGFCPEWMSKCGYWKTNAFKKERADYVNTLYGDDVLYFYFKENNLVVSNTGKAYILNTPTLYSKGIISNEDFDKLKLTEATYTSYFINGHYVIYVNNVQLDKLVYTAFGKLNNEFLHSDMICHIDGNEWNNNIINLKLVTK